MFIENEAIDFTLFRCSSPNDRSVRFGTRFELSAQMVELSRLIRSELSSSTESTCRLALSTESPQLTLRPCWLLRKAFDRVIREFVFGFIWRLRRTVFFLGWIAFGDSETSWIELNFVMRTGVSSLIEVSLSFEVELRLRIDLRSLQLIALICFVKVAFSSRFGIVTTKSVSLLQRFNRRCCCVCCAVWTLLPVMNRVSFLFFQSYNCLAPKERDKSIIKQADVFSYRNQF